MPLIYTLFKAAFRLQGQRWVVKTETTWPAKPKIFTLALSMKFAKSWPSIKWLPLLKDKCVCMDGWILGRNFTLCLVLKVSSPTPSLKSFSLDLEARADLVRVIHLYQDRAVSTTEVTESACSICWKSTLALIKSLSSDMWLLSTSKLCCALLTLISLGTGV